MSNHAAHDNVDITAQAIAAQKLDEGGRPGSLKLIAPAKVNLHLAIGEKRDDGYHEACSLLHALLLHDILYMSRMPAEEGAGLRIRLDMVGAGDVVIPPLSAEDNIVYKALVHLAEAIGRNADEEISIRVVKKIPLSAGLGGGSSDAAAALIGAAHFWGVDVASPLVEEVALTLGSDVPFFLHGGCAYFEGTGDEFVHDLKPACTNVVLVKPEEGVSTAAAYRMFDTLAAPTDEAAATAGRFYAKADEVILFNNLAPASEQVLPELVDVRKWLVSQAGVSGVLLCGSGSTTFALCETLQDACRIVSEARKKGWWARSTTLASVRAALVE